MDSTSLSAYSARSKRITFPCITATLCALVLGTLSPLRTDCTSAPWVSYRTPGA